ncbi:hypothetical protein GTY44_27010 [Streptomyces sp. SID5914]|nr:hypothetical protein [Streptomyces sp. SID5914]
MAFSLCAGPTFRPELAPTDVREGVGAGRLRRPEAGPSRTEVETASIWGRLEPENWGRAKARKPPQARASGHTTEAFTVDWGNQQVTCPQGALSIVWSPCYQRGTKAIVVRFAAAACQACPAKSLCTRSTRSGRQLSLRPRGHTRPSRPPAPGKIASSGSPGTASTPRSRAPWPRPPTSPASAAPVTSGCPRSPSNTPPHQPDPAGRLVDRQAPRPDPHHPSAAAQPELRRLNPNGPTGSCCPGPAHWLSTGSRPVLGAPGRGRARGRRAAHAAESGAADLPAE